MYVVDVMALERGHIIIRLPPYNCDLNTIELTWAKLRNVSRGCSVTGDMSAPNLRKLAIDAMSSVTAMHCKKVQKLGILQQTWNKEKPDRETKLAEIINKFATDYHST